MNNFIYDKDAEQSQSDLKQWMINTISKENNNIIKNNEIGKDKKHNVNSSAIVKSVNITSIRDKVKNAADIYKNTSVKYNTSTELLLLDTKYADYGHLSNYVFKWSLNTQISSNPRDNIVLERPISNIIMIKILPFNFPYLHNSRFISNYNLLFATIKELSQINEYATSDLDDRIHFIFRAVLTNGYIRLENLDNIDPVIKFTPPLNYLSSITLEFTDALGNIISELHQSYISNIVFNATDTVITFTDTPGFLVNDNIVIENFTTNAIVQDSAVIAAINDKAGHLVTNTAVNPTNTGSYIVTINTAFNITGTMDISRAYAYLSNSMFTVPIEITYIH